MGAVGWRMESSLAVLQPAKIAALLLGGDAAKPQQARRVVVQ